jgi:hypothetical protein
MGGSLGPLAPWLAAGALAWTGLWLIAVPASPRFRRATDARLQQLYRNDYSYHIAEAYDKVDAQLYFKIQELTQLRDRTREILHSKFGQNDPFAKDNLSKLDTLAISYLQLLRALSEYGDYLQLVDPQGIERELAAAQAAAVGATAEVQAARQKQVTLLQDRLERYRRVQQRIELVRAECGNIETTMKLLVDQAMTAPDSARVGRDIDEVLSNIRESEVLSQELASFTQLEEELDRSRMSQR